MGSTEAERSTSVKLENTLPAGTSSDSSDGDSHAQKRTRTE